MFSLNGTTFPIMWRWNLLKMRARLSNRPMLCIYSSIKSDSKSSDCVKKQTSLQEFLQLLVMTSEVHSLMNMGIWDNHELRFFGNFVGMEGEMSRFFIGVLDDEPRFKKSLLIWYIHHSHESNRSAFCYLESRYQVDMYSFEKYLVERPAPHTNELNISRRASNLPTEVTSGCSCSEENPQPHLQDKLMPQFM